MIDTVMLILADSLHGALFLGTSVILITFGACCANIMATQRYGRYFPYERCIINLNFHTKLQERVVEERYFAVTVRVADRSANDPACY
jgi:hypothetical protein